MRLLASIRSVRSLAVCALVLLGALPAWGQEHSALEASVAAQALEHFGWEAEPHPDGQIVEEVAVFVLPVFDKRDPIPNFVNALHVSSREWIIRQEMLLREGQVFDRERVLETERNLRALRQVSVANVVAAKGASPGQVRLIVIVKDVWSLRLNSNLALGSDGVDSILLNPAEENVAGTHIILGLLYHLERDRHSFGFQFTYPRIAGSRYWVGTSAQFSTNRDTGAVEGSAGYFGYKRPLYSRRSTWAFGTSVSWNMGIARRYEGSEIELFEYGDEAIPVTYRAEALDAQYWWLRSWGILHKANLSVGLDLTHRRYRSLELDDYSPEAVAAFEETVLPVSDRSIRPYVKLSSLKTRFHRVLDLELLGLQEDWRLGYESSTMLFAGAKALGSTRDHVGADVGAGYTLPLGDGLVRVVAANRIVVANDAQHEGHLHARARVASPTLLVGRLHADLLVARRYFDYLNVAPYALGGNNRLRGHGFNEFRGRDALAMNLEFRTSSVDILSAQVGLAAFVDVGDAPARLDDADLKVGTGAGLRILFPQAEREVLRLDWGLPIWRGRYGADHSEGAFPGSVYLTFGQAFSMPTL